MALQHSIAILLDADTCGMSVIPSQFDLIGKLIDASAVRQRVTAQNIANLNTPGYKAREISFEQQLAAQLSGDGTQPDLDGVAPREIGRAHV